MSESKLQSYLDRNVAVASAVGCEAAAQSAHQRLARMTRAPAWLLQALDDIEVRAATMRQHLVAYRDQITIATEEAPHD